METTLGGGRLGSGNKQEMSYKNYERSTHDLSYIWRSSMASGTLVPFMNKLALPGDQFRIELNAEVMTLPTIGPLFGSYKVQLDIFEIPLRLYNAKLHMNKLGIGMDMANIFLPQIRVLANNHADHEQTFDDNEHINPSSLLKYLGISGLGKISGATNPAYRDFNATPFLAYWDIYKNYYSNKQEEVGYFIHTSAIQSTLALTPIAATIDQGALENFLDSGYVQTVHTGEEVTIIYPSNCPNIPDPNVILCHVNGDPDTLNTLLENMHWDNNTKRLTGTILAAENGVTAYIDLEPVPNIDVTNVFGLEEFNLTNIDDMRDSILRYAAAGAFTIINTTPEPYGSPMQVASGSLSTLKYACQMSQEGLGIKTYQSDLFNNWINTEWIEGATGVSELTAVDTTGDSFTIDALNIAQKVYTMLNRIAISGGTYDDWLDAVYTHERVKAVESPIYHGSLIKELAFQEVISQSATVDEPLGTLAGRGRLTDKHKGGLVNITINEPSIIMGIASLTPRIEYSQGNDWTVNLKTYDDLHKPALDAIGYQDLITEQLLWSDTVLTSSTGATTKKSLGKQPAWINYMTEVNKVYGAFAEENNSMFMVLNRRYSKNADGSLKDGTTYIDPTKFNHIFAQTSLDSQNFWVQIGCNIEARRKMSAKVIPNL